MDYITTTEAAELICCGRRHVTKLYHAGRIEGRFFGPILQIERASALAYRNAPTVDARRTGQRPIAA